MASRENAANGLRIIRIFVFPNHKGIDHLALDSLTEQMRLDSDAQIQVKVAFANELYGITIKEDFGVWDDELMCEIETGPDGIEVVGAYFCVDPDEVDNRLLTLQSLNEQSQPFSEDLINSLRIS